MTWPNGTMWSWPFWWRSSAAHAETLDRALDLAAVDIFADAERILGQEENAGDDIAHQRLAAERHRQAEHRGAGDQGRDVDAELRQHQQAADHQDDEPAMARRSGIRVRRREAAALTSSSGSAAASADGSGLAAM